MTCFSSRFIRPGSFDRRHTTGTSRRTSRTCKQPHDDHDRQGSTAISESVTSRAARSWRPERQRLRERTSDARRKSSVDLHRRPPGRRRSGCQSVADTLDRSNTKSKVRNEWRRVVFHDRESWHHLQAVSRNEKRTDRTKQQIVKDPLPFQWSETRTTIARAGPILHGAIGRQDENG